MWIRNRDEDPTLWDKVKQIIPNEVILDIESWKSDFYRVKVKYGQRINYYIIDLFHKVIALKDYWVTAHGNHLKYRQNGKEGLISPVSQDFPITQYYWDVIIPCDYSSIIDYLDEHGLIRVINNNKWGIIDAFNNIVVPIEYSHLSPIYPLVNGQYRVIALKNPGEAEFNLLINKKYSIEKGDNDVPLLKGHVIHTLP